MVFAQLQRAGCLRQVQRGTWQSVETPRNLLRGLIERRQEGYDEA